MGVPLVRWPESVPLARWREALARAERSRDLVSGVTVDAANKIADSPHLTQLVMNTLARKIVLEAAASVALLGHRCELPPVPGHSRDRVVDRASDLRELGLHGATRSA